VPYSGNPILTQRHLDARRPFPVTSTGHADFVQTPNGEWWAVFLGVRPYREDFHNTGRETFLLPVRWENGWPMILRDTATVPYVHRRPRLPTQSLPPIPTAGNFTFRDEFDGSALKPYWQLLRTPRERWYSVAGGRLTIRPRPVELGVRAQPSLVARRQQHLNASASTAMRYVPTRDGERAGLVAYQSDDYLYSLTLTRREGADVIELQKRAGPQTGGRTLTLTTVPVTVPAGQALRLRIDARGAAYDFLYAIGNGAWQPVARDVDGTILSSKVAGGFCCSFVGTMFALYAYAP
jgi:alpha-N-arabinofuranosidase